MLIFEVQGGVLADIAAEI